jgi:hypothetical protein
MIVVLEASNLQPSRIMTAPFCGNVLLSHTDAKLRRLRVLNHIAHGKLKRRLLPSQTTSQTVLKICSKVPKIYAFYSNFTHFLRQNNTSA